MFHLLFHFILSTASSNFMGYRCLWNEKLELLDLMVPSFFKVLLLMMYFLEFIPRQPWDFSGNYQKTIWSSYKQILKIWRNKTLVKNWNNFYVCEKLLGKIKKQDFQALTYWELNGILAERKTGRQYQQFSLNIFLLVH